MCVLGHRSQEILVSIMIHWSYKFEKHFSYSCYILHSLQSKRSGKCCTHGESQHTTVHNSRLNAPRNIAAYTFNLLFPKFIGLLLFLLHFIASHGIMIPWKTLWKTLVLVILAFTYYTWIILKGEETHTWERTLNVRLENLSIM